MCDRCFRNDWVLEKTANFVTDWYTRSHALCRKLRTQQVPKHNYHQMVQEIKGHFRLLPVLPINILQDLASVCRLLLSCGSHTDVTTEVMGIRTFCAIIWGTNAWKDHLYHAMDNVPLLQLDEQQQVISAELGGDGKTLSDEGN